MLIGNLTQGADCETYEAKLNPLAQKALAQVSFALRRGAISEEEHKQPNLSVRGCCLGSRTGPAYYCLPRMEDKAILGVDRCKKVIGP
jgi:hypothetical protein